MKINEVISEWVIIPQSIKPLGLIHKPGTGPNDRFGFKNTGNNKANEEAAGERAKMYHQCANMKSGRKKKK